MKRQLIASLTVVGIVLCAGALLVGGVLRPAVAQIGPSATEFGIDVDPAAHQAYSLWYPVTYIFELPPGSSGLRAQYRVDGALPWQDLPEPAPGTFSGINAARFDYANDLAYLSVGFEAGSDHLYLRILDGADVPVVVTYDGIARMYDDRDAAVTISMHNWANYSEPLLPSACAELGNRGLYHTVGVITFGFNQWDDVQTAVDAGYTEIGSKTRTHPCTAAEFEEQGYDWEIGGSHDDIANYVTLNGQPYNSLAYFHPCGFENVQTWAEQINAGFLVGRDYLTYGPDPSPVFDFMPWNADGAYEPMIATYVIDRGADPLWLPPNGTEAGRDEANAAFDAAYAAGGIYHLHIPPHVEDWTEGNYYDQHLDHIAGRADVWYAGWGWLYMYHVVGDRDLVVVYDVDDPPPTPTGGPSPTPSNTPTSTPTPTATATETPSVTPVTVYNDEPGLQGLWRFEEVAGERADSSLNSNTLADNNGVGSGATDPPQGSRYASFVRADEQTLSIGDAEQIGLDAVGDYSLSVWLRPNTGGFRSFGVAEKLVATDASGFHIYFSGGSLIVSHRASWSNDLDVSEIDIGPGEEIPDGDSAWTHLAITYDASETTVRYYIDGFEVDSAVDLGPAGDSASSFVVGAPVNGTHYTGLMDELTFLGTVLSPGQVLGIYEQNVQDSGVTPTPTNTPTITPTPTPSPTPSDTLEPIPVTDDDDFLQGLWQLELTGSLLDSSQNNNLLQAPNGVGSGATDPPQGDGYATFARVDAQYLTIDDATQVGLDVVGDYSMSVWLRPNTGGFTSFSVVQKLLVTDPSGFDIYFSGGSLIVLHRSNWTDSIDVSEIDIGAGQEIPDGNTAWTHLAITYDSAAGMLRYYVNGEEVDSATGFGPPGDSMGPFVVGAPVYGAYYTGYMDELSLFDRLLSAGEVLGIYQYSIVPPTAVDLVSFEASARDGAVVLTWETANEIDNAGFNLYRAESPDGARRLLNGGLIPPGVPPGSLVGADYEFWDMTIEPNVIYYYWLEDVDLHGKATEHGPVSAVLRPRKLPGWEIRRIGP